MKGQLRINEIFAFIVLDDDGTEGVPAILTPLEEIGGFPVLKPLMGADLAHIDSLRRYVQQDPLLSGKKITIAKFSVRTDLEVIDRRN
jgi:hypothetical protein